MPRKVAAMNLESMPPIQFHHEHDTGPSDLHTARFSVSFVASSSSPIPGRTPPEVIEWATDNCEGAFENQPYSSRVIFAQESDATLVYLRFK